MATTSPKPRSDSPQLQLLAQRLKAWRATRTPGQRIPEELWKTRAKVLILFALNAAVVAWAAESRINDALLSAAQKAMPREVDTNELVRVLQAGLWNSNRTAVAVSVLRPKATVV
jgi:hypothetical protein